jgi:hypothetical protein
MRNYLGVYEIYEAVEHVSVTGQGSVYEGLGPYTLSYPFTNFSDEIWATADAELAFYGDVWPAAINKATETYFTTFLGYPLEAIPDLTDRQDVLTAFFNTCGDELKPIIIHVGDLEGNRWDANRGRWDADVTITVHDENEDPVDGVLASGVWSNGAPGSGECTTDNDGQCQIVRGGTLKNNVSAVTFSIDGLLGAGFTYNADSNHDPDGDSDGTEITILKDSSPPPPQPGDTPMHVGDLDGSSESTSKANKWNATVTVTVHNDEADDPINGITVSGTWSGGTSGGGSCTSESEGQCSITKNNIRSNASSVTFSVDSLTDNNGIYRYDSTTNHDPDGDSTGTSIEISQQQP